MLNRTLAAATAVMIVGACTDGTGPAGDRTVSLSFTSASAGTAAAPRFSVAAGDTTLVGSDILVVDRVQIVLREVELKRVNHDACDSIVGDDDGCEEFETGPILVDLPLGGTVETVLSVAIDTGTYGELEFKIHKPEDDDTAFLSAHPDFAETSIRVTGSFNGTPFVYDTDLGADQEFDLVPPLTITDMSAATNVTLRVDLSGWFIVGGALVDPQTANKGGQNEGVVKENVKNSFEAFEDHDRDGHHSGGDDSGDDH